MDERLRFVAEVLEGESKTSVCREFGISRKTGCKSRKVKFKGSAFKQIASLERLPPASSARPHIRPVQAFVQLLEELEVFDHISKPTLPHERQEGHDELPSALRIRAARRPRADEEIR